MDEVKQAQKEDDDSRWHRLREELDPMINDMGEDIRSALAYFG